MTASPLEPDVRKVPKRGLTSQIGLQKGSKPDGRDAARLGSRARCGDSRMRRTKSAGNSCSWKKLDFLSTLCQSVINPHLMHGKRSFNSSAPAQARPGRKFGFESAVDFERATRSRYLTNETVFCARCKRGIRFKPISAAVLLPASLPQLPSPVSCRRLA
jgi:hypothetical protein